MRAIVAIPARINSSRLPRKLLADLGGRPVLWRTWNRACQADRVSAVVVVTDSEEIEAEAKAWGAAVLQSPMNCKSGTDRIAAVLDQLPYDIVVNLQGDEPFMDAALINSLVEAAAENVVATGVFPIRTVEQLQDSSLVKVALTARGRALYFSRSPIPCVRDAPIEQWCGLNQHWGHVGIYAFQRTTLIEYPKLPPSRLEAAEHLEQLRWLEAGFAIQTVATELPSRGIDTLDDLTWAREALATELPNRTS